MSSHSGTFVIRPLCAKLIHDTETFGKMDPYCKVGFGSNWQQTKVAKAAGKFPNWQDQLALGRNREESLSVEVWDFDDAGKDDLVGAGSISVGAITATGNWEDWVELRYEGNKAGEVRLNIAFKAGEVAPAGLTGSVPQPNPQEYYGDPNIPSYPSNPRTTAPANPTGPPSAHNTYQPDPRTSGPVNPTGPLPAHNTYQPDPRLSHPSYPTGPSSQTEYPSNPTHGTYPSTSIPAKDQSHHTGYHAPNNPVDPYHQTYNQNNPPTNYPPQGYPPPSGYTGSPNPTLYSQPGYPNYPPQSGYAAPASYPNINSYQDYTSYQYPPAYPTNPMNPTYPPQAAYPPATTYPPQPGYPPSSTYPPQPGYPPLGYPPGSY